VGADLQPMAFAPRSHGDYAPLAGARAVERLQDAAELLRGARVLYVSAAGAPGPVPELHARAGHRRGRPRTDGAGRSDGFW
jgi:hypothetical protein